MIFVTNESRKELALEIINNIELQNIMAPPDIFGGKSKVMKSVIVDNFFGYSPENPIPCNDVYGEECYISRLREDGTDAAVMFHRLGSTKGDLHMVDTFECITATGNYFKLYLDMYYYNQISAAPKGFHLAERSDGLTGFSYGYIKSFPEIYAEIEKYAKKVYGYPIVDSSIKLSKEGLDSLKKIVNHYK